MSILLDLLLVVGQVGVDPTMSEDESFTGSCVCRFATDPDFLFLNIRDYWETGGFLVLYAHNFLVHSVGLEPTSPLGTASLVLRVFQFRHECICVRLYLRETVRWNLAANIYYD